MLISFASLSGSFTLLPSDGGGFVAQIKNANLKQKKHFDLEAKRDDSPNVQTHVSRVGVVASLRHSQGYSDSGGKQAD